MKPSFLKEYSSNFSSTSVTQSSSHGEHLVDPAVAMSLEQEAISPKPAPDLNKDRPAPVTEEMTHVQHSMRTRIRELCCNITRRKS